MRVCVSFDVLAAWGTVWCYWIMAQLTAQEFSTILPALSWEMMGGRNWEWPVGGSGQGPAELEVGDM